jgi:twitching motility protein PilT
MELLGLLREVALLGVSDIYIVAGRPLCFKRTERIQNRSDEKLTPERTQQMIHNIYQLANARSMERLLLNGDDDFSFSLQGVARFRISAYRQRGSLAAVIRVVPFTLPDPKALHIPEEVLVFGDLPHGLVLVTGPSGSGKSTTLACIIDRINQTRSAHIITLEDPIEYLHNHKLSIVSQREIELDTESYVVALRAALRQSPDVILIGELRDTETISIAMTAAETGHLVISTLHTLGAANTIDRIVDVFPSERQAQIRLQMSMVLQGVVSQQLLPASSDRLLPVFEIMRTNNAVRNMIRESKTHQLHTVIAAGADQGMCSMDSGLFAMAQNGDIDAQTAIVRSLAPELMHKRLNGLQ